MVFDGIDGFGEYADGVAVVFDGFDGFGGNAVGRLAAIKCDGPSNNRTSRTSLR